MEAKDETTWINHVRQWATNPKEVSPAFVRTGDQGFRIYPTYNPKSRKPFRFTISGNIPDHILTILKIISRELNA
jgi:hypothetical protein